MFSCCQDPKIYVNTILEVHKKYNALVLTAFNNDSGFVAALDKACGRFINSNAVTRQANSSSKSPELLAKYCDLLLKKSSKNPEEAELEDTLNQVVSMNFEIGIVCATALVPQMLHVCVLIFQSFIVLIGLDLCNMFVPQQNGKRTEDQVTNAS
jgi:hypothetical protein